MTTSEFLVWADTQSSRSRYELIDGYPEMVSPERILHVKTKLAVTMALVDAVKHVECDCHVLPDGVTVRIDDYTAYEPDALVYLGELQSDDDIVVENPIVVVEVLSPTSIHRDTVDKLRDYFKVDSILHYLIVDPEMQTVTHHQRGEQSGIETVVLREGKLLLSPPGVEVSVPDMLSGG